jgi:hypothetical protein
MHEEDEKIKRRKSRRMKRSKKGVRRNTEK